MAQATGRRATSDLTVIVLTYDEELNLPDTLESVEGLDSEVFVVDSGSTDRTVEIAKEKGTRIFEHPFLNYGAQRNWAIQNLPIETEWMLHLDADERLTPELRENIKWALEDAADGVSGFLLRRRTVFLGQWIKHGGIYPTYHARLFRRGKGRCEERLYDQHYVVDGTVEKLSGDMIDTTQDLSAWTARHARWAAMEAEELLLEGDPSGRLAAKALGNPMERRRWLRNRVYNHLPLFLRPVLYFLYRYLLRLGFLDGKRGLVYHFLQGCWYRFQVDAYILQSRLREGAGRSRMASGETAVSLPKRKNDLE